MECRDIIFKPFYWLYDDSKIYISGLTKENKSVLVVVQDFLYDAYLELPKTKSWSKSSCELLIDFFNEKSDSNQNPNYQHKILSYKLCKRYKLNFNEEINCIQLFFKNQAEARNFYRFITFRDLYPHEIGKLKKGELKLHEHNIDPIIKFTSLKCIKLSNWISVKEIILEEDLDILTLEERKFSSADIDCYTIPENVIPVKFDVYIPTYPKYMSFDIECYCTNLNSKIPDPKEEENIVLSVSLVVGRTEIEKKILLIVGDPLDIPDVEIIRCKTEKELLLNFTKLVQTENPDIFLGYNILSFDWNYMIERAKFLNIPEFFFLGRNSESSKIAKISWDSKAYSSNNFLFVETIGRLHIDLIIDIKRNHKLQKYSLDFVAEHFLGQTKNDISPKQLFLIYKLWLNRKQITKDEIEKILPNYYCTGVLKQIKKDLLKGKDSSINFGLKLVGEYNVQDSYLTLLLFQKLDLWLGLQEMSDVLNVPISWLHLRGQQIKVLAQLNRLSLDRKNIIPFFPKDKDKEKKYKGATVLEAELGFHEMVSTLDFQSLYPSIMIAFNICSTTFVRDDKVPDSECNIVEWEEEDKKYRYRFKKVNVVDDQRVNEGLFPKLVRKLLEERKAVIAEMKICKNDFLKRVLHLRQWALKIAANSAYGTMGAENGILPFPEGAASVTAMGRKLIKMSIEYIEKTYIGSHVIYGDTDSCMIKFIFECVRQIFQITEECGKKVSKYLKAYILGIDVEDVDSSPLIGTVPINLVPENVYSKFMLLSKKRYIAHVLNIDGTVKNKMNKGVLLARRDNCKFVRDSYQMIVDSIFDGKTKEEIMVQTLEQIKKLVTRQIPVSDMVLVKGIKSLLAYAIKNKEGKLLDSDKNVLDDTITDPLDSRLTYRNTPEVLLLKKILQRGDIIPPNSRIEFLYLRKDDAEHEGEKAEEYLFYRENKKRFSLQADWIHYVESQFETQISQLIEIKFGYKTMEKDIDLDSKLNLPSFIKNKKQKVIYALRNANSKIEKLQLQIALGRLITKKRLKKNPIIKIDENFIKDTISQLYFHRQVVKEINGLIYC
jgi:DNA polymerase delta subunit 1